jgi:hypothetical protein
MDTVTTNGLLNSLIDLLKCTFAISATPEDIISGEPALQVGMDQFCLLGGSNLGKTKSSLTDLGHTVTDHTIPGWTPTKHNIECLLKTLNDQDMDSSQVFVLDMLGNVAFRYEQLDGTLALPYKVNGKYHMAGEVKVCNWDSFKALLGSLKPILGKIPGLIVFHSPIARYLYTGCCQDPDHCLNVDTDGYVKNLIRETIALRNVCISELQHMGVKNFIVPDLMAGLLPACTGIGEYAKAFKHLIAQDGVHLTQEGYKKLAQIIIESSKNQKTAVDLSASGSGALITPGLKLQSSYYWRGFSSPVGTPRPSNKTEAYKLTHGGGGKWPPNSRGPAGGPY